MCHITWLITSLFFLTSSSLSVCRLSLSPLSICLFPLWLTPLLCRMVVADSSFCCQLRHVVCWSVDVSQMSGGIELWEKLVSSFSVLETGRPQQPIVYVLGSWCNGPSYRRSCSHAHKCTHTWTFHTALRRSVNRYTMFRRSLFYAVVCCWMLWLRYQI